MVSHDRCFVDAVATDIIQFANAKLTYMSGNFSDFERAREELLASHARPAEKNEKKRAHLEAQLSRHQADARRATGKRGTSAAGNQVKAVKTKLEKGQFSDKSLLAAVSP